MSNRCHVVVDPSAWRKLASPDDYAVLLFHLRQLSCLIVCAEVPAVSAAVVCGTQSKDVLVSQSSFL
jgi:hypothetical protein